VTNHFTIVVKFGKNMNDHACHIGEEKKEHYIETNEIDLCTLSYLLEGHNKFTEKFYCII